MDDRKLAGLCSALPALRREAERHDATERLEALVDDARATGVVAAELFDLATRWRVAVDVAGDPVRADPAPLRLPLPEWVPFPQVYGCPAGACARRWVRRPGVTPPWCHVHGAALGKPGVSP